MSKSYCVAIDTASHAIEGGLGYIFTVTLPAGETRQLSDMPHFDEWLEALKTAVAATGDEPFSDETYAKKLAVAHLMHDINAMNSAFGIIIGSLDGKPAVQIRSANTFDSRIDVYYSGHDQNFKVREYQPVKSRDVDFDITENGRVHIIDGFVTEHPFLETEPPKRKKYPRPQMRRFG